MKIAVIVATHGHTRWKHLARIRALPSVEGQGADEVLEFHDTELTLAQARNVAASRAYGDYLIFLDADDELEPGYVDAMRRAMAQQFHEAYCTAQQFNDDHCLFVPRVAYVKKDRVTAPKFPNRQLKMTELNWCVIGTAVPRKLLMDVGWFHEWPCYEDWELFLRCMRAGAQLVDVPDAIYRAHLKPGSRNEAAANIREETYRQIRLEHSLALTNESAEPEERAKGDESTKHEERAAKVESAIPDERAVSVESTEKRERR